MLSNFDEALRFDAFMHKALYDPQWGYYARGECIFGAQGDFVTAPEISPLFGKTIGQALQHLLPVCGGRIYEFGAGTGQLACDILAACGEHVLEYCIVDVSGGLKAVQADRLAQQLPAATASKVRWLSTLPDVLAGVVIGNEVLDAIPVRRFKLENGTVLEAWAAPAGDELTEVWRPTDSAFEAKVRALQAEHGPWPEAYTSEIAEQSDGLVSTLTERLLGAALMIDYGYHESLYYHPSRTHGTLRATQRHVAHDDFLGSPGEQDLTAHVNFSAVYRAIVASGGQLEGYTNQAGFLLGNGILALAQDQPEWTDPVKGAQARQGLNTLLAESDMGEQFKVIAWSRGVELDGNPFLNAFLERDRSGEL